MAPKDRKQSWGNPARLEMPKGCPRRQEQHEFKKEGWRAMETDRLKFLNVIKELRIAQVLKNVLMQMPRVGIDKGGRETKACRRQQTPRAEIRSSQTFALE